MPSLRERIPELLDYINSHENYLRHNRELLDIHQGNLKSYVEKALQSCLSPEYYSQMKERIIIINILKRFIDKVSKVYAMTPMRTVEGGKKSDEDLLDWYEEQFEMNVSMNDADEYSNLFKGYLLDPYLSAEEDEFGMEADLPRLRVVPFDRFLVKSDDSSNPLRVDICIKLMGKKVIPIADARYHKTGGYRYEERDVYYAYTKEEFLAFDSDGELYMPAMKDVDGTKNPLGFIPSFYGHRSRIELIPRQDSDILEMTKIIPVLLSDLSGCVLFQCFSLMYGIDVNAEGLVMSPNGFLNIKSDAASDKKPEIGVITPKAEIDKVLNFIMQTFVFWLETKGIKVGSVGNVDAQNVSSGIAKIIDEMDTTEIKKLSIKAFKKDEAQFWKLVKKKHNYWVDGGLIKNKPKFTDKCIIKVDFDEPKVIVDRQKEVATVKDELDAGLVYPEKAIKRLYPDADDDEIKKHLNFYRTGDVDGMAEGQDSNRQRPDTDGEERDSE